MLWRDLYGKTLEKCTSISSNSGSLVYRATAFKQKTNDTTFLCMFNSVSAQKGALQFLSVVEDAADSSGLKHPGGDEQ